MNIYSLRARVSERPIVIALSADMRVYLYVCVCANVLSPGSQRLGDVPGELRGELGGEYE